MRACGLPHLDACCTRGDCGWIETHRTQFRIAAVLAEGRGIFYSNRFQLPLMSSFNTTPAASRVCLLAVAAAGLLGMFFAGLVSMKSGSLPWVGVTGFLIFITSMGWLIYLINQLEVQHQREIGKLRLNTHELSELDQERYLLNTLMDKVPDRIYFKDLESRFIRNNRAHLQRFGLNHPAQLLGKSDFDFFPRAHAERTRADEIQIIQSGEPIEKEEKITWPDGREDWAQITKIPLRDRDGKIIGTFGISRDVTQRKRVEEELKLMSNRLQLASQATKIGIWDYNPITDRLIWDEKMFQIYQVDPRNFSGTYGAWKATLHPDDVDRENQKIQELLRHPGEFDSEFRILWPDKSIHYLKANALVAQDSVGRVVRMIGTNRDITAQKHAEEELKHAIEELGRSNAALEQFAYVASHDLQEPLRAITGCIQILQKSYGGKLDKDADELIRHAVEGAARMRNLIGDLLAFSRVGTGGKPFELMECEVALDLALANLSASIEESHAIVTRDPLPVLHADSTQIPQLFQNLISNALKFHGNEAPRIHIGAVRENGDWRFSVGDQGIGIDPQYKDRIFVIFQRLHTRSEYPGTGIGLALCKRIVERHNGKIWFDSELGKGCVFYFTIPDHQNSNHES